MTAFPTKGWLRRYGTYLAAQAQGRVPYEKMAALDVRRARRLYQRSRYWRRRIFPLTRVYRASNPPLCVVVVVGGLRGSNITVTPMVQPPQSRPTKRWPRRNGAYLAAQAQGRVPYDKMASPSPQAWSARQSQNGCKSSGKGAKIYHRA